MAGPTLRVTGGVLRGRVLRATRDARIRSTSAKVRAAAFNVVGPVDGLRVADLYCGSGALGIEALSRGAAEVVAVDRSRQARQLTLGNYAQIEEDLAAKCRFVHSSVERWIDEFEPSPGFDLVLMDPPYAQLEPAARALEAIFGRGVLVAGGLAVFEHSSRTAIDAADRGFRIRGSYRYGDSALTVLEGEPANPRLENGSGR